MTTTSPRSIRLDALAYGGDYNPDQWPESVWAEDARLMVEAGVNLVTLPVFSWPLLEPRPGEYDFAGLDRVIDLLWEHGIRIDLATATATPPAWLVREHPEVLPWNVDGVRLEFGSRQSYCPSSPIFREAALRLTRTLAERYGEHPALALWHVSNEYGDHVSRCWCPESARHFRRWLRDRYETIDGLNEAWGTSCWGQHYLDFDQIEPPRTATGPINPAELVDFERFSSDALLELFQSEIDVLREVTPDIAVTTNFMSLFRELDYWDFADAEDLVTDDAYPDPADPDAHIGAALNYGLMRSLKDGRPWLLLEQAPSAVSWREVNVPKAPGQMRVGSMQAIAHGSDGVLFFQWRQAKFGPEKFHSAMLGHRGERSRTFQEAKALGAELKSLAPIRGTRVRASVALVADWDSWWGVTEPESLPSVRLDWLQEARAWHAAAYALGQPVDVARAAGPYGEHRVLLVPNLYATTPEQADALTAFVDAGGQLVVGPFSGVVDHREQVHDGGAPGPLRDLLGVEVDEWWPLADGQTGTVAFGGRTPRRAGLERVARRRPRHRGARDLRRRRPRRAPGRHPPRHRCGRRLVRQRRARRRRDARRARAGLRRRRRAGHPPIDTARRGRHPHRRRHRLHVRAQPRPVAGAPHRASRAAATCSPAPTPTTGLAARRRSAWPWSSTRPLLPTRPATEFACDHPTNTS